MSNEAKTLKEIWHENEDLTPIELNLYEKIEGQRYHPSMERSFIIQGKMPKNGAIVFFGWYVSKDKAKFWSAYGHEKPADIYGTSRWVL